MGLPMRGEAEGSADKLTTPEKGLLQKLGVFADDADEAVELQPAMLRSFRIAVLQNEERAYEELKESILRVTYHAGSSSDGDGDGDGEGEGQDEEGPALGTR